jgi:hypothetical protein
MSLTCHFLEFALFSLILLGPLPLCWSLLLVTERGKEKLHFPHCALTLLTGWCMVETVVVVLSGIFHRLTLGSVLVCEVVAFLSGVALSLRLQRLAPSVTLHNALRWTPLTQLESFIVGSIASVGLVLLWQTTSRPITDWDSLRYHLPTMANWYQTGSLAMLDQYAQMSRSLPSRDELQLHRFPYSWEALCALFFMPFREDFLVAFPNLVAWILLGLSIYLVSLQVGATRTHGMAAAGLMLTVPIVIEHVNTMHVDLPFAAFFMVGVYWILLWSHAGRSAHLAIFLATLGMLWGIKMTGPFYGFLLIAFGIFVKAKSASARGKSQPMDQPFAKTLGITSLVCFLVIGSFWYVRNLIELGNPLGYAQLKLAGVTIFPGTMNLSALRKATSLAGLFQLTNLSHWKILAESIREHLSLPFFLMGLQSLSVPLAVLIGRRLVHPKLLVGLTALLMVTGYLYWTMPFSAASQLPWRITPWIGTQFRFALPTISLLCVMAAAGSSALPMRDEIMAACVCISSLLAMPQAIYVGIVLLLVWGWFRFPRQMRWTVSRVAVATVLSSGLFICGTFAARKKRDVGRHQAYQGIAEFIAKRTKPDEIIGYLSSHKAYLFYGKDLSRKVIHTPSKNDNLSDWLALLKQRGVRVVAIGPREAWMSAIEFAWLEDPNGAFVRVFGDPNQWQPLLYRFKESAG